LVAAFKRPRQHSGGKLFLNESLVARAQDGDARALERLLIATTPLVRRIISGWVEPDERDDLLHDVQMRVCAKLGQYERRSHGHFLAWLTVLTRHIIQDDHRRRVTQLSYEQRWARGALVAAASDVSNPRVELLLEVLESKSLTSAQRDVIVARYTFDQDCATIARERGCTVATVYKLLTQAYARIRADLTRHENEGVTRG